MNATIYANYGVLAHEKTVVYTATPHHQAALTEKVEVEIPESLNPSETMFGGIIIEPNGSFCYELNEALCQVREKPAVLYYDRNGKRHTVKLEVIKK